MRIALISQEFPPARTGGIATQTDLKARALAARGHEVTVITRSPAAAPLLEHRDGFLIRNLAHRPHAAADTELADWITHSTAVAETINAQHAKAPLDLIEFPEWGAEGFVHLLNRTEWNMIPTVIQLHGPLVMLSHTIGWPRADSEFYRVGTAMEAACLRQADGVYSSSQCSAQWCSRHYGLALDRTPILHTGVDTELFHPGASRKADRPTIVFTGKLVANKGVFDLLQAACRVAASISGLHLRLLGPGEAKIIDQLHAEARSAGFPDLLETPGSVSRLNLPGQLAAAHVFAAPSHFEGGPGFVHLEAMACGLPVIACSGSGVTEVINHGSNGFLVAPGDVEGLAEHLRLLLTDPRRRASTGLAGRSHVLEHAHAPTCLLRIEEFYQQVRNAALQRRRQPSS